MNSIACFFSTALTPDYANVKAAATTDDKILFNLLQVIPVEKAYQFVDRDMDWVLLKFNSTPYRFATIMARFGNDKLQTFLPKTSQFPTV